MGFITINGEPVLPELDANATETERQDQLAEYQMARARLDGFDSVEDKFYAVEDEIKQTRYMGGYR